MRRASAFSSGALDRLLVSPDEEPLDPVGLELIEITVGTIAEIHLTRRPPSGSSSGNWPTSGSTRSSSNVCVYIISGPKTSGTYASRSAAHFLRTRL